MLRSHDSILVQTKKDFVASGWDVKRLMKQIVLSKTYRQSSKASPEAFLRDPEDRSAAMTE